MKHFRKIICYFFGHHSILLHSEMWRGGRSNSASTRTSYQCERCEHKTTNQWDT
jgi:hypothetical protein